MKVFIAVLAIAAVATVGSARKMARCDFVHAIQKAGMPGNLGTWTCVAQHESNFDTAAHNSQTGDWGILQISQIYWCNEGSAPGKGCHTTCAKMRDDDITDDLACARTIWNEWQGSHGNGFSAWVAYKYCTGNNDAYLKGC